MAEKILNTRLKLRYDSHENWISNDPVLYAGEVALSAVSVRQEGAVNYVPSVLIKVGDGTHKYSELDFVYAKAADVVSAAKTEAALTEFINGVIASSGLATDSAMTTLSNRVTAAEGKINTLQSEMDAVEAKAAANETAIGELEGLVGEKNVATQIQEAIAALDLANTYDAKGSAAAVQTALDTYKTSNDAAVLANKNSAAANASAIEAIKDGTTIDSFADVETALSGKETAGAAAQALADAKTYADGLASNYDAKGSAAQALTDAKAYADGLAVNYDAKGAAAQALTDAKAYTDDEIAEWVGEKNVATQISEAITGLDLANTYDAKGAAAQALTDAKSYADGLNTAMDTRVQTVEAKAHEHANKAELDKIATGDKAKWDAMEQNAKDYADGLNTAMDGRVADLEAMFGDGEGTVESQIAAAVAAETSAREAADTALGNRITAIENDYLKAADKTELQGAIDALEVLVGDTAVATQISTAVAEEKTRAEGVESGLNTRLAAVETDYLKTADKTALQNQITANANAIELLTNGVSADEVDGVNDLIQYVKDHGTEVTGIKADIKANADAIDAIEADYLKAADKTALQEQITANDGDITALQTAVGTKAAQTDLEALAGRVTTVEGDLNTETTGLKARMTAAEADIDTLAGKVGDESVADQITAAIDALKIGDYAKAADLIAAVERIAALETDTHTHANKAELDKFVSGDKAKLDTAVQTVTAGTGLTTTKTGTDVAIGFDDTVTFVFDCGDSTAI